LLVRKFYQYVKGTVSSVLQRLCMLHTLHTYFLVLYKTQLLYYSLQVSTIW